MRDVNLHVSVEQTADRSPSCSSSLHSAVNQHPHTEIITTGTPASARRSVSSQSLHSVSQLLLWLDGANPPPSPSTITPTPLLRAAELNLTSSPPVRLCISTFTTRASGEVACCSERGCKESGGFQKLSHSSPLLS